MIDHVDQRLMEWVSGVLPGRQANLVPPGRMDGEGVNLYLIEMIQEPRARGAKKPPLQVALRYVVSVHCEDVVQAHQQLWTLLLDATERAEHQEWSIEPQPLPMEAWAAMGTAPRPSFILRVPVRHEYPQPQAPRVTKEIVVEASPATPLHGIVLGPREIPIMGASVHLPSLGKSTYTDSHGRFTFPMVPSGSRRPTSLVVRAKGETLDVALDPEQGTEPVVIHLQPTEV